MKSLTVLRRRPSSIANVCVSRMRRRNRDEPTAIAGSIRFDATKRAMNQAFTRLKVWAIFLIEMFQ
ncbi:hypothetical protein CFB89_25030 [Burkholderia sp. AU16741]|nr:hypothetical protein CFB89_25030 [Burkholderia sp. AU16741]